MATSKALDEVLAQAHAQVRAVDWSAWQVLPGDARLAEYLFADQPPLTNGLLQGYLGTCAWIWQRPIAPAEQQRAAGALIVTWTNSGLDMNYEPLLDVLSMIALPGILQALPIATAEDVRQALLRQVPDGHFPGIDVPVPGAAAAAAIERAKIPASTLSTPDVTGVALDGLYSATTFGLQLDITGPPGSGTWGSTTEVYAFFTDGTYLYFPSPSEAGAHIQDPRGHKAPGGQYEVIGTTIRLYDASDGRTNTSDFAATPDGKQLTFYGKAFTRVGDTANLR